MRRPVWGRRGALPVPSPPIADGDIRPWPGEAPAKGKGRRAKRVTATLKAVKEMRPACTEIIICTGLRTRGGQQLRGVWWPPGSCATASSAAERRSPRASGRPAPVGRPSSGFRF